MKRYFAWIGLIGFLLASSLAGAEDNLNDLYENGNSAFSASDYTTATYYYGRMLESEGWDSFPQNLDVLRKLAMIDESQAQFEQAVVHYRQLIERLSSSPQNNDRSMMPYYLQRYAENLERIGRYEQAGQILWRLVRESDSVNQPAYLTLLLNNYNYQRLTDPQIDDLRALIVPALLDSVGWEFANLLFNQERHSESLELFDKLWPSNPIKACEYSNAILTLYTNANRLDDLFNRIRIQQDAANADPFSLMVLEIALMEESNKGEEALSRLEQFILDRMGLGQSADTERMISMIPSILLDRWIDLLARHRGNQPAIQILSNILQVVPMDLPRRKKLADLLMKEGRLNDAVQLWDDWAQTQSNTPMTVLNAAEEIFSLGKEDTARQLLDRLKNRIPPPLAWRQGQAALQFGDFNGAAAAFEIAVASGGIPSSMIVSVIHQFAQTKTNHDNLVSNLIEFASGCPFSSVPEWIRIPLLQYGVQPKYRDMLNAFMEKDPSGAWKFNIANEAIQRGDESWALSLLQSLPPDSLYRVMADQKRGEILALRSAVPFQREAADLLAPSIQELLSATAPIALSPVTLDRLMRYTELRLNAFQPNEALEAIRSIESASATLDNPLSSADLARIAYNRARVLTELASLGPAIAILEKIDESPYREDAKLLLARIYIAQRHTDIAVSLLHEIASDRRFWRCANDALSLLAVLEPLVGDSLQLFCDATMYELQGRMDSAIPPLRQLAVDYYGGDLEEWARYYIGKLKQRTGDTDGARQEWERLILDVDEPVVHGLTQLELLQLNDRADAQITNMTYYQDLLIDMPNSLFADLARLRMQREFGKEQP